MREIDALLKEHPGALVTTPAAYPLALVRLTSAVQRRVGPGKFSQYVIEAVARQLELDLLADLSGLLASEHGPVPGNYLAEARAAWPDDE